MHLMGQWSLMPSSKTEAVILSFLFYSIKSIRVDLVDSFRFGQIGSLINSVKVRLPQISFK